MDTVVAPPPSYTRELTLRELLQLIRRDKWLVILVTLLCTSAAATAAFLVRPKYTADIVLSPVTDSSNGNLGALGSIASQFSGLASIAGLSLGGGSRKAESLAVLESDTLTERYIGTNNLLPILYSQEWDANRRRWILPSGSKTPTLWKADQYFKKSIRSVATDPKTGLVTLSITWYDPITASAWANGLVQLANQYLQGKAIAKAERNIDYLKQQAAQTDVLPVKEAIYSLLENQINKEMIAKGSDEYAFEILDPAQPPERASFPQKRLWIAGGFILGLFVSAFGIIFRAALE